MVFSSSRPKVLSLRPATIDDLKKVVLIEEKSQKMPWSYLQFAEELDRLDSEFWVLTDDESDTDVHAFSVLRHQDAVGHLLTIAVDPLQRRKGHGRRILQKQIQFATKKGFLRILLEVRVGNLAAVQLYQAYGFWIVETKRSLYSDGEDGHIMEFSVQGLSAGEAKALTEDEYLGRHGNG